MSSFYDTVPEETAEYRPSATMWLAAVIREVTAQKDRLILWLPVFFACGIGLYFSLKFEPPVSFGFFIVAVILACQVFIWPLREDSRPKAILSLLCSALLLMSSGFCVAQWRTMAMETPMLLKSIGPVDITGIIAGIDKLEAGQGSRVVLEDLSIEKLSKEKTPYRVRLKVRKDENLVVGNKVTVLARLNPPSAPVAPRAFDFQRYAYFKRIGAFGFAYSAPEILEINPPHSFQQKLESLRQTIAERIGAAINDPESAVATALMTGERTAITEEDWEAMRASGLAHMLAISGLHVGLVATVLFFTARFLMALVPALALKYPIKKYAAFIALVGAFSYMLIVGSTIPTIRAMMMTGIVLCAVILDRTAISMRLIALAAFVVLLISPEALWGASFQMSFSAVAALIFFYEQVRPYWSAWYRQAGLARRIALYFLGVCMTTVVATLATAPFALFHFQQLSLYSLLSNLLAGPLMAFVIMPTAVLSYLAMIPGWEQGPLWLTGKGVSAVLRVAHDTAALPESTWNAPAWPLSALISLVTAGLFLMLWKGRGKAIAFIPFMISILIIFQYNQPDIFISSNSKLISLRDQSGSLSISSRVHDRFSAEIWARRNGQKDEKLVKWPKEGESTNILPSLQCGEQGCRVSSQGTKVAFSFHPGSHEADCSWADILIATDPLRQRNCHAALQVDRFDNWGQGAHAIWFNGRLETVESVRGKRPWSVSPRR